MVLGRSPYSQHYGPYAPFFSFAGVLFKVLIELCVVFHARRVQLCLTLRLKEIAVWSRVKKGRDEKDEREEKSKDEWSEKGRRR